MKMVFGLIAMAIFAANSAQATEAKISYVIRDSKIVFLTKVENFKIDIADTSVQTQLPCTSRYMWLATPKDLYEGWDASAFDYTEYRKAEDASRGSREYIFSSCRTAKSEVLAWFADRTQYEGSTADEVSEDKYDSKARPVLLQARTLPDGVKSYFTCDGDRTKVKIAENEKSTSYEVSLACRSTAAVNSKTTGPLDFALNPGPYAALISYRGGMLPSVPSTAETLGQVTQKLFGQVPPGKYTGVMRTLKKTCELEVSATGDALLINHTITTGKARTRRLELKAENLLGYVEGLVYADPLRIEEKAIGTFAAAEFRDPKKGGSIHVRFENLQNQDGLLVRINGSEAYCRRMVK